MTSKADKKDSILIVDDQPDNIWSLNQHLQSEFDVLYATSGEEALEIALSENRPDLILLDIVMPGMDGYEVCEKLKADTSTCEIPIIFLTSKTADLEQVKGLDLGAKDYITKPFSLPVVTARIKSVLNLKKEMNRRLLLKAQLENLNQQLERQVIQKQRELETTRKTLKQYEEKWRVLFDKKAAPQDFKRIMVVDDNPENVHILVKNLQSQYEMIYATSGKEALEMAFSDQLLDLILLDIMMPDMDGFEVCSRLKANTDTWDIPVIFVTALNQEVDETKGLNLGAVDFVTKPFSVPVVKARINAALRLKEEMEHRITLARRLEELNKTLEERIREKTAALEQAHEDLKVSEEKYRSIYENAMEGIFQTTPEGRLLDANPSLAIILGYESTQELVATITDAAHQLYYRPQDRNIFIDMLKQKGKVVGFETQFKKKNGQVIWVLISAKAVRGKNNELLYFQGFFVNVSERKQAEEELRKHRDHLEDLVNERTSELEAVNSELEIANKALESQAIELAAAKEQAETANAAKSDFLARMSHDIRTPLNAVTGLTNIVLKSNLTHDQRNYLNKVQIAGGNLLDVINDILDFSKVEAGRLELACDPFDLYQMMARLESIFGVRAAQNNLNLRFALAKNVPQLVNGDASRLTQILTNLIGNAIKFTVQGEVIVGVDLDEEGAVIGDQVSSDQTALKFTVSDTGIGIDADVLPRLFDPFTQADDLLTSRHEGTGLGLAICRQLVRLMGGRIWAESTTGKGSTFSFTVVLETRTKRPEAEAAPTVKEFVALPVQQLAGRRVLLVEDSELNQDVAVALLEEVDLIVETAENGQVAVDRVTSSEPGYYDTILMDIQMPIMDGYEATRRIRAWEHQKLSAISHQSSARSERVPIVALTAHALKGEKEKCLDADMDDYLPKPLDEQDMHRVLIKWIPH